MSKAWQGEVCANTEQHSLLKHTWAVVPILCHKGWGASHGQRLIGARENTSVRLCRDAFGGQEVLDLLWVPHALSQSYCHSTGFFGSW